MAKSDGYRVRTVKLLKVDISPESDNRVFDTVKYFEAKPLATAYYKFARLSNYYVDLAEWSSMRWKVIDYRNKLS